MQFTTRTLLVSTAIVAILTAVAIRLPSLAAFIVLTGPFVVLLYYWRALWARSPILPIGFAVLAFPLAYIASIGPWNFLVSPTESNPDHPWTKTMVATARVIYAPILSSTFVDSLDHVGLKRHYSAYHNDWYVYGTCIFGVVHDSEYVHG